MKGELKRFRKMIEDGTAILTGPFAPKRNRSKFRNRPQSADDAKTGRVNRARRNDRRNRRQGQARQTAIKARRARQLRSMKIRERQ